MKKNKLENFLDKIPLRKPDLKWSCDDNGIATLEVENKGIANRIAQKLIKKPKISYIHLDNIGSFIWNTINGERDLTEIGILLENQFGEKANPLYERLAQYFRILENYGFIIWK